MWSRAAVADFVRQYGVGITVESLTELEDAVRAVPEGEYRRMRESAAAVSEKLRSGFYFYKAIDTALKKLHED